MDYKLVNLIIMIVSFVGYVSFIWLKYGIQKSISASYYVLPKNEQLLFTFFCWSFAVPAMILGDSVLMFLTGSAISFVGAAAAYNEKMEGQVHMTAAVIGIMLSQASIAYDFKMWWINLLFIIPSGIILLMKKRIPSYYWWIELLAFGTITYVLGVNI